MSENRKKNFSKPEDLANGEDTSRPEESPQEDSVKRVKRIDPMKEAYRKAAEGRNLVKIEDI